METILVCPHCMRKMAHVKYSTGVMWQYSVRVVCEYCHCSTAQVLYGDNGTIEPESCTRNGEDAARQKAIDLWNGMRGKPEIGIKL